MDRLCLKRSAEALPRDLRAGIFLGLHHQVLVLIPVTLGAAIICGLTAILDGQKLEMALGNSEYARRSRTLPVQRARIGSIITWAGYLL
jgi:hypothetical protein